MRGASPVCARRTRAHCSGSSSRRRADARRRCVRTYGGPGSWRSLDHLLVRTRRMSCARGARTTHASSADDARVMRASARITRPPLVRRTGMLPPPVEVASEQRRDQPARGRAQVDAAPLCRATCARTRAQVVPPRSPRQLVLAGARTSRTRAETLTARSEQRALAARAARVLVRHIRSSTRACARVLTASSSLSRPPLAARLVRKP